MRRVVRGRGARARIAELERRLAESEAWLEAARSTAERAAVGDLEARMAAAAEAPPVGDDAGPRLRASLNHLLDVVDAYVREAGASLDAASHGRFHRRMLLRGLPGSFRVGAGVINEARETMAAASRRDEEAGESRAVLVRAFEENVIESARSLTTSSERMALTADELSALADGAVRQTEQAGRTVTELESSATVIQDVVRLIAVVAEQTRLLALNATIEAAHAGVHGRGFGVVAAEVKRLADESSEASARIEAQLAMAQGAIHDVVEVLGRIDGTVRSMSAGVHELALRIDGTGYESEPAGLRRSTADLDHQVRAFLEDLRV